MGNITVANINFSALSKSLNTDELSMLPSTVALFMKLNSIDALCTTGISDELIEKIATKEYLLGYSNAVNGKKQSKLLRGIYAPNSIVLRSVMLKEANQYRLAGYTDVIRSVVEKEQTPTSTVSTLYTPTLAEFLLINANIPKNSSNSINEYAVSLLADVIKEKKIPTLLLGTFELDDVDRLYFQERLELLGISKISKEESPFQVFASEGLEADSHSVKYLNIGQSTTEVGLTKLKLR